MGLGNSLAIFAIERRAGERCDRVAVNFYSIFIFARITRDQLERRAGKRCDPIFTVQVPEVQVTARHIESLIHPTMTHDGMCKSKTIASQLGSSGLTQSSPKTLRRQTM